MKKTTISNYTRKIIAENGLRCKNSLLKYFNRAVLSVETHQGYHPDELAIGFTVSNNRVTSVSPVLGNWSYGNWSFFPTSGCIYEPGELENN